MTIVDEANFKLKKKKCIYYTLLYYNGELLLNSHKQYQFKFFNS